MGRFQTDTNLIPKMTWNNFTIEKITIDATGQAEVDCSGYDESTIVSSSNFTISESSSGAEYPIAAYEHFYLKHTKMDTFYLNGVQNQEIFIMWGKV
jgi:hypothetical protein